MNHWYIGALCLAFASGACDDDRATSLGTSGAGGSGTGGSTSSQGGAGGGVSTFAGTILDGTTNEPLADAGVAIDLSDGTRVEGVSNADGDVSVTYPADVTWRTVIAHKDGYEFMVVPRGVFREPFELAIRSDPDRTGYVRVAGTATNIADPLNDSLVAYAKPDALPAEVFEEQGVAEYHLLVPPSVDFTLLFLDLAQPVAKEQDLTRDLRSVVVRREQGLTRFKNINVDFVSEAAPVVSFAAAFIEPADAELASSGLASVEIHSARGLTGASAACHRDAVNREFDCLGWLVDNGAAPSSTTYVVADRPFLRTRPARFVQSVVSVAPDGGTADPSFPNPLTMASPTGPGPHPVDIQMRYRVADGGGDADYTLYQLYVPDGRPLGRAVLPPRSFTIPALPSTSNEAAHFLGSMRVATVRCRGRIDRCSAMGVQEWDASPPTR